ncbi:MAG: leucine-, isoleucine, valine-, threonine-, and alanine-binding protein BraC [Candidatus Parcubacteria bacterium]|jgi:branched-chain amino acid transport system substrate-binding protein
MKKVIFAVIVIIILILVVVFAGKSDSSPQTIKIGSILSETGVAASFGEMSHKGIELAAKELNESGVNGQKVQIVYEDDQTDPKTAAGLYHKLTGVDHVDAIIGSNFDFVTQPLFSLAKDGDTIVISPSNPRIPGSFDTNKNSFVMMTEFSDIIRVFKTYLSTTTYKQLGIVRFESSFAEQIEKTLNDIQIELGKKPLISETYKQIGNNDFRTQILKLKQSGVDLVFLDMIAIDPYTFVTQAKQLGYNPKIITHVGLQDALSVPDVDPKVFNGVVSVNWNVSTDDFIKRFNDAYGIKPDKSANRAYDAVYILVDALTMIKKDKSKLVSTLETVNFTTPNGSFAFNKNHSAVTTQVRLDIVKDGKFETWVK